MQFLKPENLVWLWLVPGIFLIFWFSRKLWRKRMRLLIREKNLASKLIRGYRSSEWRLRSFLMALTVGFLVLALAQPQWGDEKRSIQRKGVDLIFMVDTSLSMLAEDIKPNRLV